MHKSRWSWLIAPILVCALIVSACGAASTPTEEAAAPAPEAPAVEAPVSSAEGGCPTATMTDRMGVAQGEYLRQYELADFQSLAGCELGFSENPNIADLNAQITNNPDLPSVAERLPEEPLVVVPYEQIGVYGGTLNALSNATEAGTSDFLSVRHVNFVRYGDDFQTIEPNVAKGWEFNDDFTELTVFLRKGHKWSDGAPFTAADVAFWVNDLVLNAEVFPETPGFANFGTGTMMAEAIDETTVKFSFPAPTPGILSFFATTYIQPFQPKHFFDKKVAEGMAFVDVADLYYGNSDWKDVPSPLLSGEADDVLPTLEAYILVEETTEGRRLVANPYFFMVDTAGQQLPYIDQQSELYVPDKEVRNLKITNGEVDYKVQSVFIDDFPLYKENEANGNYTVHLADGVGELVFYGFNLNHKDEGLREIFNDLRFRQAMSVAINRPEIVEAIYLGQATPMQATPADPNTVSFVTEEHKNAFIEYNPDQANALLDEMGLADANGDGLRERADGSNLTLDLQFSNQGGPVRSHELIKEYWGDVGINVNLKEVTSDEYREQAASNDLDILTWKYDGTAGAIIVLVTEMLLPPFGEYFNPGVANLWAEWHNTDGASGIEPPDDVKTLYEIVPEFLKYPLGSPESNELGEQIVDLHVNNLWKIGIAGNVKAPVIHSNRVRNFGPYSIASYDYYRAYPMIPQQWFISE